MSSSSFSIYDFNLAALSKISELNIRQVAESNKRLTADEYFIMLSQFLSLAGDASDAIKRFANDDSNTMDWKIIKDILPLFEKIRCVKFIPDLTAIRNACERGDHRLASSHANKIIDDGFLKFCSYLMAAKMTVKADDSPSPDVTLIASIKDFEGKEATRKLLVLAVDDSPAILESVAAVLGDEYTVFKLPKPAMLENILKQVKPDLFLLDYLMPDRNGFELIPVIRGYMEYKYTPIVFLTSEGTMDNITAAVSLGACDFIVKPFLPDQLKEKVAKHIAHK